MVTTIFIVARDRRELFDSLSRTFANDDTVRVLLDRRAGERRRRNQPAGVDRRQGDRRAQPHVEAQLRSRGWALVSTPGTGARDR